MKCSIFWNKQEPGRLITKHLFKRKGIAKQHRVMWCSGSAVLNWGAVLSRETVSFHSCSIVVLYCCPSSTGFTIFVRHLHNSDSVVWSRVFVYLGSTYLGEFDDGKSSCRKLLDGHNRYRWCRKPQPDTMASASFITCRQGLFLLPFSMFFPSLYLFQ